MKRALISLILLVVLLAGFVQPVYATTYWFHLEKADVAVFINSDGTVTFDYTYTFYNDAQADPMDYVDIGLPNDNYNLSTITAEINDMRLTDISTSEYVPHGIAVGLGNTLPPASRGVLHVNIPNMTGLIYTSEVKGDQPYASLKFETNFFDSSIVYGETDMTVTIFLPPDVVYDTPFYYNPEKWPGDSTPEIGTTDQGLSYYRWHTTNASASDYYVFGTSFPSNLVPTEVVQTAPIATINSEDVCCIVFGLVFVGVFGLIIYQLIWGAKKRRLQYLPPKIAIEGNGIKRGLTSVEAAILMEQPMDKILTMILFSTLKKEAADVVSKDPLKVKPVSPLPEGLNAYEVEFLSAMNLEDTRAQRSALQEMMVNLVKSVTEKMRGFSRKETVAYYTDIMKRAWEQVEAAETPEIKMQKYDEVMGWTMLDENFSGHTQSVFNTGPVVVPMWWSHYQPSTSTTASMPSIGGSPKPGGGSYGAGGGTQITLPTLPGADFAASVTGSIQNFAGGILGDLNAFTGGVTNKTNPVPTTTSSGKSWTSGGGGGGGGHSCVCACACACAGCACACAGGGR